MKKYKLFFDSAFNKLNLALIDKNNEIVDTFSILTNNNLTEIALEHLHEFLIKNKIKIKQIDSFYVTVGPGSFTGVRVGCIVAKTWCKLNEDCKLFAINSLRLQVPFLDGDGISVLDARGNKEYYAVYKKGIGITKLTENTDFEKVCQENLDLPLYKNYENMDIFESLINNLDNFEQVKKIENLEPLYIKKPVS